MVKIPYGLNDVGENQLFLVQGGDALERSPVDAGCFPLHGRHAHAAVDHVLRHRRGRHCSLACDVCHHGTVLAVLQMVWLLHAWHRGRATQQRVLGSFFVLWRAEREWQYFWFVEVFSDRGQRRRSLQKWSAGCVRQRMRVRWLCQQQLDRWLHWFPCHSENNNVCFSKQTNREWKWSLYLSKKFLAFGLVAGWVVCRNPAEWSSLLSSLVVGIVSWYIMWHCARKLRTLGMMFFLKKNEWSFTHRAPDK